MPKTLRAVALVCALLLAASPALAQPVTARGSLATSLWHAVTTLLGIDADAGVGIWSDTEEDATSEGGVASIDGGGGDDDDEAGPVADPNG